LSVAQQERQQSNLRLAIRLGWVALFFVGFGFAMVPMYDAFCKLTGLNGKTNAAPLRDGSEHPGRLQSARSRLNF
jgi:cytochrome c oxidase assembly protein subunit 11